MLLQRFARPDTSKTLTCEANLFWERLEDWPSEPPDWMFLGSAVLLLGDEMFGGSEEDGDVSIKLADWWQLESEVRAGARWWHDESWDNDPTLSGQEKELWQERRDRFRRYGGWWDIVQEEIRELAESGILRTGRRPLHGGVITAIPPVEWSTQDLSARFYCCQMNPTDPYGPNFTGQGFEHIFVSSPEFFALLQCSPSERAAMADEKTTGTLAPATTRDVRSGTVAPVGGEGDAAIAPWDETRMCVEIKACQISNRDKAWTNYFKPRMNEHGWDNPSFRLVWAKARGTEGLTGRPPKRA